MSAMTTWLRGWGVGLALITASCSTQQRINTETAVAKVLVSDEQENQLGAQFDQELAQKGTGTSAIRWW